MLQISLCPSPVLYPYYKTEQEEYTVVIVDIFRAGTTITTALMNGAVGIIPIATVEEAEIYAGNGFLVGGERGTKRLPFARFGNAPEEYARQAVEARTIDDQRYPRRRHSCRSLARYYRGFYQSGSCRSLLHRQAEAGHGTGFGLAKQDEYGGLSVRRCFGCYDCPAWRGGHLRRRSVSFPRTLG